MGFKILKPIRVGSKQWYINHYKSGNISEKYKKIFEAGIEFALEKEGVANE